MLYLITGVPGSGKTLKMISDLMTRDDLKNRPLYLDGIPEVDGQIIPNLPIPEGETMQTWHKWAPTGAILVIDECQRVFRPRPSGSKVPDYVAELETHRHKGIDIFLLTQHPRLIDANVRSLIGHHCHIGKTSLGVRRMVEWERCANPEANGDIANGVKSVYKLDKKAFGVYKSAEEHTKIKTKRSKVIFILPLVLIVIIFSMFIAYGSYKDISKPIEVKKTTETDINQTAQNTQTAQPQIEQSGQYPQQEPKTTEKEEEKPYITQQDYEPRIAERPETAPIYDGMNKAFKAMPWPSACIKSEKGCNCYTDQGTKIKEISKKTCVQYVNDGLPFNPYKTKQPETAATEEPKAQSETPQVLTMGGKSPQNLMYDGYNDNAMSNQGGKVN